MLDGGVSFQTSHCISGEQKPTTPDSPGSPPPPIPNRPPPGAKKMATAGNSGAPPPFPTWGHPSIGALNEPKDLIAGVRLPGWKCSCCSRSVRQQFIRHRLRLDLRGHALPRSGNGPAEAEIGSLGFRLWFREFIRPER